MSLDLKNKERAEQWRKENAAKGELDPRFPYLKAGYSPLSFFDTAEDKEQYMETNLFKARISLPES